MSKRQGQRKRRQREDMQLQREIERANDPPSEGQYCVIDKVTKKKYKGLSFKEAQKVWNSLENAIILIDGHVSK